MKKQVLSIEQMHELKKLGIDTSKASMFWHPAFYRNNGILDYERYEDIPRIKLENNYNLEYDIPTFALQDIIELLPQHIEEREIGRFDYELIVRKDEVSYDSWEVRSSDGYNLTLNGYDIYNECETLLDCAFEMLKWVKKEKYI